MCRIIWVIRRRWCWHWRLVVRTTAERQTGRKSKWMVMHGEAVRYHAAPFLGQECSRYSPHLLENVEGMMGSQNCFNISFSTEHSIIYLFWEKQDFFSVCCFIKKKAICFNHQQGIQWRFFLQDSFFFFFL